MPTSRNVKTLFLVIVLALAVAAVAAPVAAAAGPYDGAGFGEHVSDMAKMRHFSGDHNPGVHQGVTGWPHHHGAM